MFLKLTERMLNQYLPHSNYLNQFLSIKVAYKLAKITYKLIKCLTKDIQNKLHVRN